MKTNIKIRLLVAALGGNVFFYSDARASDWNGLGPCEEVPVGLETFDFSGCEAKYPAPYRGIVRISQSSDQGHGKLRTSTMILHQHPETGSFSRRPTITGTLSQLDSSDLLPIMQQERGLARIIPILVQKYFFDALPAFVDLTVTGFRQIIRNGSISECSLEEYFTFSLIEPDTFQYVTRDQRPPRESVAIYGYATDAVMGRDGIINRVKRNIMDEILMILQFFIMHNIPDELIAQLENYVDHVLGQIVPALKQAMFEILRDIVAEMATGCCSWCKKLSKEDKKNLTRGICHMLGGVLGRIFGEGFELGADELANGICGIIANQNE
ncbi:MAG: hypothetical protein LBB05_02630 [Puniceicoccales bacterium]|nr:hypothetical protein [Puniceicoccales bacterium]